MINCDFQGCRCVPIVECRCRRCDREPDEVDRDHSCAQHCDEVAVQHKRRTERDAVWQPYSRPTDEAGELPTDGDPLVRHAAMIDYAEENVSRGVSMHMAKMECIADLARALRNERAKVATATETLRAITALVKVP